MAELSSHMAVNSSLVELGVDLCASWSRSRRGGATEFCPAVTAAPKGVDSVKSIIAWVVAGVVSAGLDGASQSVRLRCFASPWARYGGPVAVSEWRLCRLCGTVPGRPVRVCGRRAVSSVLRFVLSSGGLLGEAELHRSQALGALCAHRAAVDPISSAHPAPGSLSSIVTAGRPVLCLFCFGEAAPPVQVGTTARTVLTVDCCFAWSG